MTIPVIIRSNGKVEGIRGLYIDPSSKRVYVRFSFHGVDRQVTICPKNLTYSELNREASKALYSLKKEVKSMNIDSVNNETSCMDMIERGKVELESEIILHWRNRGVSEKYITSLISQTRGLSICKSKKQADICRFNKYNGEQINKIVYAEGLSGMQQYIRFRGIKTCFSQLIESGRHTGVNPIRDIPKPILPFNKRKNKFTFKNAAEIVMRIRELNRESSERLEIELFFVLCIETGQRPKDLMMFDVSNISSNHYQFKSHKTNREHRVSHIISPYVRDLISRIIIERGGILYYEKEWKNKYSMPEKFKSFWKFNLPHYRKLINQIIQDSISGDAIMYLARHFFVTELFRRTNSEFWAEVFTHEGKNTNQTNYLHPDQEKADEILVGYTDEFEMEIKKLEISRISESIAMSSVIPI